MYTHKNNLRLQIYLLEIRLIETQLREILLTKLHPVNTAHQNTVTAGWFIVQIPVLHYCQGRGGGMKKCPTFSRWNWTLCKFKICWKLNLLNIQFTVQQDKDKLWIKSLKSMFCWLIGHKFLFLQLFLNYTFQIKTFLSFNHFVFFRSANDKTYEKVRPNRLGLILSPPLMDCF